MRHRFTAVATAALLLIPAIASAAPALKMEQIPAVFTLLTQDKTLANPAMVLIDTKSGQIIFSKDPNGARKPASTLKLLSAMAALEFLPSDATFTTSIYKTSSRNTFQIVGDFDPSLTPNYQEAKSDKFVWSNYLVNKIRSASSSRHITLKYYGVTSRTLINMQNTFRRAGYHVSYKSLSASNSLSGVGDLIASQTSPPLTNILRHTLLWSDNYDAEYLARIAAMKAGYPYSGVGVDMVFKDVLSRHGIDPTSVEAKDGSGLSKENRVSAATLGKVLIKLYSDPKFASVIAGLPVGGVSGTLRNRFLKSAPQGVGLVRAKTGSLNGVVNLAGFIDSGEQEYAFVILADRVRKSDYSERMARAAIDKILGKIAAPRIIVESQSQLLSGEQNPVPNTDVVA